ncbi:MAG: hypothetical protein ACJAWQ_002365 [Paraglaciecola sp.]|jgi:zona occludens toxin (predicted ATPase)
MNQAVQVLDGFTYVSAKEAIKVDIMYSGQMLACYINGLSKEKLTDMYKNKQFEIEDIIEQELEQDKLNSDGEIWLSARYVYAY